MTRRHQGLSLAVVMAFALVSVAPAFAQQGDEEPSRRRHGATPDLQPALEVPPPPLRQAPPDQVPPDQAPPGETVQPLVPPPPLPDKTLPKKTVRPVTPPPPVAVKKKKVPPAAEPAPETETARLLRQGKKLLAAKKLTTPKGRSALDRFRQVLAIDPGNGEAKKGIAKIADTYKHWGNKASDRKEYAKAERYLVKSIEINGKDAGAYAFLGYARADQGKYQSAIEAFNRALEIRPGTADYHSGIGVATFRMKDYGAAIKAFQQAVAKRPDHADSHRMIGIANERLGDWRQAVEGYSKAYAIEPKPGSDDLALGRLYVKLKEYGKAVPYLKRAAKHYPDDPVVFDHLATAHHFLDNVPEALAAVRTRNRLEREGAKGAGKGKTEEKKGKKEGKKVAAVPPAGKPGASKPLTKPTKPPLSGVAEARANFDAGRHATAYYQYKAEAEKGNAEAAYMLGRMRHQGIAVGRDLAKAFNWYLKAARAGHAGGQAGVGYMYYRGLGGVPRDRTVAAQWYRKAARGGVSGAMARLGQMYERGDGVPYSSRTASYWLVKAGYLGNKAARKRLRELGMGSDTAIFAAPDEIDSGLGELPALSTPSGAVTTAAPTAKPAPKPAKRARPCGGGLLGGLNCAGN